MASKKSDKVILELKAQIEAKEGQLKGTGSFKPVTNCMLVLFGQSHNLNVADKNTLLFLASTLDSMDQGLQKRFPGEELVIAGFPVQSWLQDIEAKYMIVNRKAEESRLKVLKEKLTRLLSRDKQVELELAELKDQI